MNKKFMLSGLFAASTLAVVGVVAFAQTPTSAALFADTPSGEWHHYKKQDPTSTKKGTREYWVECGGGYQFTAPTSGTVIDEEGAPDTSEFAVNDDRYISYQYDENHLSLSEYQYGAGMYCTNKSDYKNWRATFNYDGFECNLYNEGDDPFLWRIDLPRIDYTKYQTVTMKVVAPNWYENNNMGPEADQLTYHTVYGGNKPNGKICLSLTGGGVYMEFYDIEYGSAVAFTNIFTDSDIIHGLKQAYFYTEDLYDRYLNITDITLSTDTQPVDIFSYAGDTSKISVVNGTVGLPGSVDYSIINNNYGTNDNSLVISGNANPGAAVMTLPAFNFDQYTTVGVISFKFGVKNNGEHMYFGSGDSKIDLGANNPASQSNNNNGYVNWEMIIVSGLAYVHNVYEDRNIFISLTAGMRNGTESIILSGGATSIYRLYLFCDYYWQFNADYPLIAPTTPVDVCSYAGDTTKISVANGTVGLPGSADYSIINNNYGTNDNSLAINGNANPGAAVMTLQSFNMNPYTAVGKISFKFGVKNNGEHMYFGSGDSKIDLGANNPASQSNNNNGYVNWEMIITSDSAYVHNVYSDQNYAIVLTEGMRAGTEGIVISGGGTSLYRVYFVTDFYWNA